MVLWNIQGAYQQLEASKSSSSLSKRCKLANGRDTKDYAITMDEKVQFQRIVQNQSVSNIMLTTLSKEKKGTFSTFILR